MEYHQRDLVEVNFLMPDGTMKPHLSVLISNDELQENDDGTIYLVLITSKRYTDYVFPITDEMFMSFKFDKQSYIACHIISGYKTSNIVRKCGRMKREPFNEMVDRVIEAIF
ncbi:MAG: type II toxin-antitoxin system PemK/MazF family toxin [Bacteroidales bacterium]|nr:type II toxin-antitoxin system PemK/MazF family toxin [Bacteroidales bacterium]